jgi:hypothetical protein
VLIGLAGGFCAVGLLLGEQGEVLAHAAGGPRIGVGEGRDLLRVVGSEREALHMAHEHEVGLGRFGQHGVGLLDLGRERGHDREGNMGVRQIRS